jgi:hypothetical protein
MDINKVRFLTKQQTRLTKKIYNTMKASIIVPSELEDITLGQYQDFLVLGDKITNEELISIFCNISVIEAKQLPLNVFETIAVKIVEVLTRAQQDIQHKQRFVLNGSNYGMIPNLEEITYGENKDLTTYLGDWKNMHMAMAVLYRPIKKTTNGLYEITTYEGTSKTREVMKQMPLNIVIGANSFFYNLTEALLNAIPNYLERVQRESNLSKEQIQEVSTKQIGDPMTKSIALLRETLEGLKR